MTPVGRMRDRPTGGDKTAEQIQAAGTIRRPCRCFVRTICRTVSSIETMLAR